MYYSTLTFNVPLFVFPLISSRFVPFAAPAFGRIASVVFDSWYSFKSDKMEVDRELFSVESMDSLERGSDDEEAFSVLGFFSAKNSIRNA